MNYTTKKEAMGGGERDLHEMGVLKLGISREIVNHRDSDSFLEINVGYGFVKGFRPDFGAFRANGVGVFSLLPLPLQLVSSSA